MHRIYQLRLECVEAAGKVAPEKRTTALRQLTALDQALCGPELEFERAMDALLPKAAELLAWLEKWRTPRQD